MNCRLPQTPRTPTAAAAHYFDDIFTRSAKTDDSQPRIRRSSTSRSIGNRSSFNISVNGDHHEHLADGENDRERRKSEANEHVAKYVTEALERLRTDNALADYDDELEASIDDS